jgi:hypothetical protein
MTKRAPAVPASGSPAVPRYLRFVTVLLLGAAATAVPFAIGCSDDAPPPDAALVDGGPDAAIDATFDAAIVDAPTEVVDGPLAPPDLPRALA